MPGAMGGGLFMHRTGSVRLFDMQHYLSTTQHKLYAFWAKHNKIMNIQSLFET